MIKVFFGENSFLSKKAVLSEGENIRKQNPNVEFINLDAGESEASSIINLYRMQDMFSPRKLILLKRLSSNSKYKEIIEDIFEFWEEDGFINSDLLIWEDGKIAKNTKYYKGFEGKKAIFDYPKFNKRSFATWAKEEILKQGMQTGYEELQTLALMTNYNPEAFENELAKFKLASKTNILLSDIKEIANDNHEYDIWQFLDAVNSKSSKKEAIEIIENLLKNKVDPNYILAMIARNTRLLILTCHLLSSGYQDKEIVSILKIPPFTLPSIKHNAQSADIKQLIYIYEKIYNLDFEIKIGNIEPTLGIILLTTKLN